MRTRAIQERSYTPAKALLDGGTPVRLWLVPHFSGPLQHFS